RQSASTIADVEAAGSRPTYDRSHRPNMDNALLAAQSNVSRLVVHDTEGEIMNGKRRLANTTTAIICLCTMSLAKPLFAVTVASDNASDPVYIDGWQV